MKVVILAALVISPWLALCATLMLVVPTKVQPIIYVDPVACFMRMA